MKTIRPADRRHFLCRPQRLESRLLLATDFSGDITSNTTWTDDVRLVGDVRVRNGATLTITPGVSITRSINVYELSISDDDSGARIDADGVAFLAEVVVDETGSGRIENSQIGARLQIQGTEESTLVVNGNTFDAVPNVHSEYLPKLTPGNTFAAADRIDVFGDVLHDTNWPLIPGVGQYQMTSTINVRNGAELAIADGISLSRAVGVYRLQVSEDNSGAALVANDVTFLSEVVIDETANGAITASVIGAPLTFSGTATSGFLIGGNVFNVTPAIHAETVARMTANSFAGTETIEVFGEINQNVFWPRIPNVSELLLTVDVFVSNGALLTINDGWTIRGASSVVELWVSADDSGAGVVVNDAIMLANTIFDETAVGGVTNSSISNPLRIAGDGTSTVQVSGNVFFLPPTVGAEFLPRMANNTFDLANRIDVIGDVDVDTFWPKIMGVAEYRLASDVRILAGSTLTLQPGLLVSKQNALFELHVSEDSSNATLIADEVQFGASVIFAENAQATITNSIFGSLVTLIGAPTLRFNVFAESSRVEAYGTTLADVKYNDFTALQTDKIRTVGVAADTIDLRENWWGTTDPVQIDDKIIHQLDRPVRPLVLYEPFLTSPPLVPDYIPLMLDLPDGDIIAGSTIPITYNVKNDSLFGNSTMQTAALFYLNVNDSQNGSALLDIVPVEPLAAGASTGERTVLLTFPDANDSVWSAGLPEDYTLSMLVDATDAVLEYHEDNNLDSVAFRAIPPYVSIAQSYGVTELVEGVQDDSLTFQLSATPTADVLITATPDEQLDLGNGPGVATTLTIAADDPTGSNGPAGLLRLPLSAPDDGLTEGSHLGKITYSVTSNDPRFAETAMPQSQIMILEQAVRPVIESIAVNGGGEERSQITSLQLSIDRAVDPDKLADAFRLTNTTTNTEVTSLVVTAVNVSDRTDVTLTFREGPSVVARGSANPSLADGRYRLEITGGSVETVGGGTAMADDVWFGDYAITAGGIDSFFRLFGDFNNDRDVDVQDLQVFSQGLGSQAGTADYNEQLDFDGDGDLDARDFAQVRKRLFKSL